MRLPKLSVPDGTIEALKWLAMILMLLDHTNKYFYAEKLPYIFNVARLSMPLFVFVLAYNLARPGTLESGGYHRTMKRLLLFGALATPAYIGLGVMFAGWWPLNIMFALLVITLTIYMLEQRTITGYIIALIVFLAGGSSVEFWWPAITLGLAVWWYCKTPRLMPILLAVVALASLRIINGNYWAFTFIPVAVAACFINIPMPRYQWVFYLFYPFHITMLWALIKFGPELI